MAGKSQENGKEGEYLILKTFRTYGYWAHIINRNNQGSQPFDIIATKGNGAEGNRYRCIVWKIDAKVVEKGGLFSFEDIQPNQIESMNYVLKYAKEDTRMIGFAIFFKAFQQLRFMPYSKYKTMYGLGKNSVRYDDLLDLCDHLEDMEREILND